MRNNESFSIPSATEQQEDIDQWESEFTQDNREISPIATRINNAAGKVSKFLETRAINKAHSEALSENDARDTQAQNEAFATYDENLATTADRESLEEEWDEAQDSHLEEQHGEAIEMNKDFDADAKREKRAESIANAKVRVRSWGTSAARNARSGFNAIKSATDTAALYAMITKDTAMDSARRAEVRFAERAAHKENDRIDDEVRSTYEQSNPLEIRESEQGFMEQSTPEDVYDAASAFNIDLQHEEALEENELLDEIAAEKHEAELKARKASYRKLLRKQAREKLYTGARERTSETWNKAKGLSKRFGRSIAKVTLSATRKVAGAASGAVAGAKAGYREAGE